MTPLELANWLERDGANCQQHIDAGALIRKQEAEIIELKAKIAVLVHAAQVSRGWEQDEIDKVKARVREALKEQTP